MKNKQLELVKAADLRQLSEAEVGQQPTAPEASSRVVDEADERTRGDLATIAAVDPLDNPDLLVVDDQLRICIYFDADVVVITQDGQHHRDEAQRLYVAKDNLEAIIERLKDIQDGYWPASPPVASKPAPKLKEAEGPKPEKEKPKSEWRDEQDCVIREQRETYIYENPRGQIVVRQIGEMFEDDPYVIFEPEQAIKIANAMSLVAQDVAARGS
ncbi:MAG TPA: hypothetical protein VGG11_16230 [Xanthobacteraceae bacterium]